MTDFAAKAREAAQEARALLDRADAAGRSLTEGERIQCKRLLDEVNDLKMKARI
jgi:hypothetical protein